MPEKIVIIPTYNEKDNISAILHSIFNLQQDFHVMVIDDSSPDGTAEIVKDLQTKFPIGDSIYSWLQMGDWKKLSVYF
jgi:dolichol-phosphate mannosyltransferase